MRRIVIALALLAAFALPGRASTLVVTNLNDVAAGCLRQAVLDAGAGDTITFAAGLTGTITNLGSRYEVRVPMTIAGPGADILAISGANERTLFAVINGKLRISGLTLRNGTDPSVGAIDAFDSLSVSRCTFRSNFATQGAAVIRALSFLEAQECTFESNTSLFGSSAAVYAGSSAIISGCTFRANVGGALEARGSLVLENSTFYGNQKDIGGALRLFGSSQLVRNCTISGNSATTDGGGIRVGAGSSPQIQNTIIAGNSGNPNPDVSGTVVSLGYNLVGNNTGSSGFGTQGSHDQVGTAGNPIPAGLAPIGDYGGPTWTMPPVPGSFAIDQGNSVLPFDQRGRLRSYDQASVPNAGGGNASDIGAYELRPSVRNVTTLADAGAGSLRQAVAGMNPFDGDSIKFAAGLKGTITLTTGEIAIGGSGIFQGPNPWMLAVHGNDAGRVFSVAANKTVEIEGLTVTGGKEAEGFAILSNGANLTLRRCRVVGNNVLSGGFDFGGAIRAYPPGKLVLENCTVANNVTGFGGGVFTGLGAQAGGEATYTNCTISGNSGPGIVSSGTLTTVRNCTIANNNLAGAYEAGGISWLQGPSTSVGSTVVAGNGGLSDVKGAFTSAGWNLVGKSDNSTGFTNGVSGDQVGTAASPKLANLAPLQSNGGAGETHGLLFPSLLLDKGHAFAPLDQRGASRYNDPFTVNADDGSDIGAYEHNPNGPVAVESGTHPATLSLASPRPNPAAGGVTVFASQIPIASTVSLDLYDVAGRRVRNLVRGPRPAGEYADRWDGRDDSGQPVPAGVYFVRLVGDGRQASRSFVVLP